MSLTLATLLPGILFIALGSLFLINNSLIRSLFESLPRSQVAAGVFFGGGAIWFLYNVWNLSEADFGEYHVALFVGFAAVAVLAFYYVPDFLAVRGLAILALLSAMPLLDAAYGEFQFGQRRFMVTAVYIFIALGIYLGAVPFRLRDFFQWHFATTTRPRVLGGTLVTYGCVLAVVAFTY
jgi:hypothetical protein